MRIKKEKTKIKRKNDKNRLDKLGSILLYSNRPYLLIIAIGLLLYSQTLFFDYTTHDDKILIEENYELLKDIKNFPKLFVEDVFLHQDIEIFYRPLLNVSFMLDAQLGGKSLFVYHLTNVLLHLIASCLLFVLLKKFFGNKLSVLWASLFFVVHPIQLQTVAWIPGRNDSLLAVFVLLSFLMYLKYLKEPTWKVYILHILLFAFSLLTKESGVGLVILIIIYLLLNSPNKIFLKDNLIVYLGWVVITVPWYFIREAILTHSRFENFLAIIGSYFQNVPAFLLYIGKIFLPFNLNTYPTLPDSNLIFGILSLMIIIISIVIAKKKSKTYLTFGAAWFIVFLSFALIRSSEIIVPEFSEHRVYVALIGFVVFLSSLDFSEYYKRYLNIVRLSGTLILACLIIMNFIHARTYKDGWSYWSKAIENSSSAASPYQGLGDLYYKQGNYPLALQYFRTAVEKEPNSFDIHLDIGVILEKMNYLEEAEKSYRRVLEINPNNKKAFQNLAVNLDKQHRVDEAEIMFKKAIEIDPNFAETYNNFGIHFSKRGMLKNAEEKFLKALALNPNYGSAHYNISILYYSIGNFELAVKHFKEAERLGVPVSEEMRQLMKQIGY